MQIPCDRGVLAVDLKRVECLVPTGITCGFKGRQGTIAETGQERTGIVNAHLLHFTG